MDTSLLQSWVNINSGTGHPEGLCLMADALVKRIRGMPGELERIPLPSVEDLDGNPFQPGDLVRFRFNPEAPVQILLSGHMDTVYGPEHPFQEAEYLSPDKIRGPGIADMKGGLFIMLEALEVFLKNDRTGNLGGEVLITADEEVGSPGSREWILEAGRRYHLGLVFESTLPGGELVSERKGAGVFRVHARGRAAHTGRDFEKGRNAIIGLAPLLLACHELNRRFPGAIVNVGRLHGGGPVNVVPEDAEAAINLRPETAEQARQLETALGEEVERARACSEGITFTLSGGFTRLPKRESKGDTYLHLVWNEAEGKLGLPISGKRGTGGGSDGNLLAEVGLPLLDGVGIKGNHIHSSREYALLSSIPEQLSRALTFMEIVASKPGTFQSLRNS